MDSIAQGGTNQLTPYVCQEVSQFYSARVALVEEAEKYQIESNNEVNIGSYGAPETEPTWRRKPARMSFPCPAALIVSNFGDQLRLQDSLTLSFDS